MYMQAVGGFLARELAHGRPEQGVNVHDDFANEMHLLGIAVGGDQVVEGQALLGAIGFERRQIAYRRLQQEIKIFTRRLREGLAENRVTERDNKKGRGGG